MKKNILAIAGRPGLYTLVSQGRGMLIVEAIDATHRRTPAGARDRVTSLNDVSMYTNGDDIPLMQVFASIKAKYNAAPVDFDYKKATPEQLADFMAAVLPDYDRDRVHLSDIRKLIQWYNILGTNGVTDFEEVEEPAAEAEA